MIARFFRSLYEVFLGIFLIGELAIVLRVLLKIFGANPETLVVRYLYGATGYLIRPFQNIFPTQPISRFGVIDTVAISAAVGYAVVALIIFGTFGTLGGKKR